MKKEDRQDIGTLALGFINYTQRNIFLTGGAGTGKTTFLKFLREHTHKKMVIAAPTGVAAINAGGVTIHALFGLPPRPLDETTVKNIRLAGQARSLLRELELLIIDEASMLRADVLDAMHYLLQDVRQDPRPMGGLQIVFVGDLYQLPPVENKLDEEKLPGAYPSYYFTDSKVFPALAMLMLELTEIYRQSDPVFIRLLAAVRKGVLSIDELEQLNTLHCPDWAKKNAVILTTHNRYASELNEQQMNTLIGPVHTFMAEINGDFSEDRFPVDNILRLKPNSRVMIIKNDHSANRQFYNGKTGWVTTISDEVVHVKFDDDTTIAIERESWSNLTYVINAETGSVKEEVLGTFRQFPLKLAWAITVHKSQGLTFEKAVIDVADAFAAGQVYVALSRVKALSGVCLKSRISPSAIISPSTIETAFQKVTGSGVLTEMLEDGKKNYIKDFLIKTFDWQQLRAVFIGANFTEAIFKRLQQSLEIYNKHAGGFLREISERIDAKGGTDWQALAVRIREAEEYFIKEINAACITPLKEFIKKNKDDFKFRGCINHAKSLTQLFKEKITSITLAKQIVSNIANKVSYSPVIDKVFPKQTKLGKVIPNQLQATSSISTETLSLQLFLAGKSIPEIADTRSLGISTIEYHLAFFIPTGEINLSDIIPQELLDTIQPLLSELKTIPSIAQLRPLTGGKLSMGQLHGLIVYFKNNISRADRE